MNAAQDALTQEWVTLQHNHEQHERSACLIKLAATVLFAVAATHANGMAMAFQCVLCAVPCILWVQEAMLRTSQARLGERLLCIEALQRDLDADRVSRALQHHSAWHARRAGSLGLLGEYARHAVRPTVAFPYAVLIVLSALRSIAN